MKDTNNLLTYQQWSCGDYTPQNNPGHDNDSFFLKDAEAYYTNEISCNGEYSVKTIQTATGDPFIRVNYRSTWTGEKTVTVTVKIYAVHRLYVRLTNNTVGSGVMVYPSGTWQEISLSLECTNYQGVYVYFNHQIGVGSTFFLDDICLTAS